MTETEKKALALVNEVAADDAPWTLDDVKGGVVWKALCRAIERLEAENTRLREAVGILEDGLQEVGDDYPGSSCQEWCQHQIKQARAALEKHHDC